MRFDIYGYIYWDIAYNLHTGKCHFGIAARLADSTELVGSREEGMELSSCYAIY